MTTREYFRKLRAESVAKDMELAYTCWRIAQCIGDSHNFPRRGTYEIDIFTFYGAQVWDAAALDRWRQLPQVAENTYIDLLLNKLERDPRTQRFIDGITA